MRNIGLVAVTAASLAAAYWVGTRTNEHRSDLYANLCLTNKAIVGVLENSLAQTTSADIKRFGISEARYEKARNRTISYIYRFRDVAPCEISISIPPDVTKRAR